MFQPETPRSASARFRTADSLSPECALTQLTTPRNLKIWHVEKVSFSFSERLDFRGNHAPNNRSARTLRLGSPPLFPMFLHVASFASTISFLSLSFRKCPSPFAFLENTLGSHASGSRETGTPCLFPGRNHPPDILKSHFHHRGHTFCDGYAHPSVGPRATCSLPPFQHGPSIHKTLFHTPFRGSGFALLWCKPVRVAAGCMLWLILLDTRHMRSGSPLCRDSLSRKRDLSSYRCSSGAPRFCRSAKAEISTKRPLLRQPRILQFPAGNGFRSAGSALC